MVKYDAGRVVTRVVNRVETTHKNRRREEEEKKKRIFALQCG